MTLILAGWLGRVQFSRRKCTNLKPNFIFSLIFKFHSHFNSNFNFSHESNVPERYGYSNPYYNTFTFLLRTKRFHQPWVMGLLIDKLWINTRQDTHLDLFVIFFFLLSFGIWSIYLKYLDYDWVLPNVLCHNDDLSPWTCGYSHK